jgi:hypothetical protein
MPIDQSKLGNVVQAQMEAIEEIHGEDCEIGEVIVIVEILCPDAHDIRVRCSDGRPHVAFGLLEAARIIQRKAFEQT